MDDQCRLTDRPDDIAFRVLAFHVVEEDVLGNDDVAFHSHDFGDVGDFARAIAQARGLNYDVDGGADHLANGIWLTMR